MANIKSAKKRIRVIDKKTQRNRRVKSHLKEILKDFEAALAAGEKKLARDKLALAEKRLMQAASKGTIHKNTASRKVARITAAFITAFGKDALLEKAELPVIPDKSAKKEAKADKKAKAGKAEAAPEEVAEESAEEKPATKSTKKASVEEAEASAEEAPAEEEAKEEDAPVEATEVTEPEAEATKEAPAEE